MTCRPRMPLDDARKGEGKPCVDSHVTRYSSRQKMDGIHQVQ